MCGSSWRIAHDEVEHPIDAAQPCALDEAHRQLQPLGIGLGHGQRIGADIHGRDAGLRALVLQRQGNRPAAGAQIGHTAGGIGGHVLQRPFDQNFCIRARIKHARIDLQRQAEKFFAARQVRHRHRIQALGAQGGVLLRLRGGEQLIVVRQQPGAAVVPQQVQQQQLRVDALQPGLLGLAQRLGNGERINGCTNGRINGRSGEQGGFRH